MDVIDLERAGDVFVLRMKAGENRLHPDLLDGIERALDEVEREPGPAALVTTGEGRFYSNGLDLEWLLGPGGGQAPAFVGRVQALFCRILTLPAASVAALNGHAFAAGAMLAFAHDYRLMRADRGYVCINEVDLASSKAITPGMKELIGCRLAPRTFHEMILTGRRYGAAEALQHGVIHEACPEPELLPRAVELAQGLAGKHRPTVGALKRRLFDEVAAALAQPLEF
jgi:enoyl-CoA hydratase/carnithine racemase